MFKKKQKSSTENADKKIENIPNNLMSVRGALLSQVKFRGYVCICLLAITILSLACSFMTLQRRQVIIGINSEGVPEYLKEAVRNIDHEVFIRDFVGKFGSYTKDTINSNLKYVLAKTTANFKESLKLNSVEEMVSNVQQYEVTQILNVDSIKITKMDSSGITAEVKAEKLRSDKLLKKVIPEDIFITLQIVYGEKTEQNPWGLFVDVWQESRAH